MGFFNTVKFYFKTFVAMNVFFACAFYGVVVSIIFYPIGKKHLAQWSVARAFYNSFSAILGIKIEVLNEQNLLDNLPAILVGNHQSTLDILVLGRIFPQGCTVTAKKSLQYIPLLGWFMTLSGTFFLDRSNKEKSIQTLNRALNQMKSEKRSLWMFPEGTRSYAKKPFLGPFKKGAFHMAVDAQVPVIPIVVSNTSNIINFKEKIFNTGTIVIDCLKPISTESLTKSDVGKLTDDVRNLMLNKVEELGYSKVGIANIKKVENKDEDSSEQTGLLSDVN